MNLMSEGSKKNDTTANDEFVNVMQVERVVIAKRSVRTA